MPDPQTASAIFFAPVAAAYLAACAGWLAFARWQPRLADEAALPNSDRRRLDAALTLLAAAMILTLGWVYRLGWLLPTGASGMGRLGWFVDNLIIYSPIALVLYARRQGTETIFLTTRNLAMKIVLGLVLGAASVGVYSLLRGEAAQIVPSLSSVLEPSHLTNFLPVFLEGLAVAFGFVRLRWLLGMVGALSLPALLFAAAHIPGQVADHHSLFTIVAFFAFNSALTVAILWTVQRSRDIVWIGMVHYLMDIAIKAI